MILLKESTWETIAVTGVWEEHKICWKELPILWTNVLLSASWQAGHGWTVRSRLLPGHFTKSSPQQQPWGWEAGPEITWGPLRLCVYCPHLVCSSSIFLPPYLCSHCPPPPSGMPFPSPRTLPSLGILSDPAVSSTEVSFTTPAWRDGSLPWTPIAVIDFRIHLAINHLLPCSMIALNSYFYLLGCITFVCDGALLSL